MKLVVLAGILASGASLQAATSYLLDFNTQSNSPGLVYDGGYAISPYSGTVNGTSVQLYCDDFNDSIAFGQQNIAVYSTALTTTGTTLYQDTRYGYHNAPGNSYTAGTTLYDEMAWLATQMQHASNQNVVALQEAIWTLTDATGGSTPPHTSAGYTGTAASGLNGTTSSTAQSYLTWIADAQAYVTAFNGGQSWSYTNSYYALNTNNWYIITAVTSAGCTVGNETNGCSGAGGTGYGTAGTGSTTQEFLAYTTGGLVTSTTTPPGVPEPATFALVGAGLLAGAMIRRRRNA